MWYEVTIPLMSIDKNLKDWIKSELALKLNLNKTIN